MAHVAIRHFSPLCLPPYPAFQAPEMLLQLPLSSRLVAFPTLTFQVVGRLILDVALSLEKKLQPKKISIGLGGQNLTRHRAVLAFLKLHESEQLEETLVNMSKIIWAGAYILHTNCELGDSMEKRTTY
jgi:hypothetical protein